MCETRKRDHVDSDEDEEYYLCNAYKETDDQHKARVQKLTQLLAKKRK